MTFEDKKIRKPKTPCMERAVTMLSRRAYSVGELSDKLIEKHYEAEEVAETIQRLLDKGFLNDERFAYERIRYRSQISGWGKKRIMGELYKKKVDSVLAEQKFLEYFETEAEETLEEQAYQLLMKKYGPWQDDMEDDAVSYEIRMQQRKEIEKDKNRRIGFLMRRGFSLGEAMGALDRSARSVGEDA